MSALLEVRRLLKMGKARDPETAERITAVIRRYDVLFDEFVDGRDADLGGFKESLIRLLAATDELQAAVDAARLDGRGQLVEGVDVL